MIGEIKFSMANSLVEGIERISVERKEEEEKSKHGGDAKDMKIQQEVHMEERQCQVLECRLI